MARSVKSVLKLVAVLAGLGGLVGAQYGGTTAKTVPVPGNVLSYAKEATGVAKDLRESLKKQGFSVMDPFFHAVHPDRTTENVLRLGHNPMSRPVNKGVRISNPNVPGGSVQSLELFLRTHPEAVSPALVSRIEAVTKSFNKVQPDLMKWRSQEAKLINRGLLHYGKRGAGIGALAGFGLAGALGAAGALRRRKENKATRWRARR